MKRLISLAVLAICVASFAQTSPTPQEVESALRLEDDELVRLLRLEGAIKSGVHLSTVTVDNLIGDSSASVRQAIAKYAFLTTQQTLRIVAGKDEYAIAILLANPGVPMTETVVDLLVSMDLPSSHRRLLRRNRAILTPAQILRLSASADLPIRFMVSVRYGTGESAKLLDAIFGRGQSDDINAALNFMPEIPETVVDRALSHPDQDVRRDLTWNGHFTPSAGQLQRILDDPIHEVRIGILRREDVRLTEQQFAAGAFDEDERLAFMYRVRGDFHPSASQIESGLTSPNVEVRRHFAGSEKFVPTDVQLERGLSDTDDSVRLGFLHRPNITLNAEQFERALQDQSFSVRYAAARLPALALNQAHFELMLSDKNPNMLRAFVDAAASRRVDLSIFVWATLRTAPASVRLALAKQRDIPLDTAQLKAGLDASEAEVCTALVQRSRQK